MDDKSTWLTIADTLIAANHHEADPLAVAVLAVALSGDATDSIAVARLLEQEHALVLRAITGLVANPPMLEITERNMRTNRVFFRLAPAVQTQADTLKSGH